MIEPAFRFTVPEGGHRVDRLVADASGRGRRTVRQWLAEGLVRVDGHVARASEIPAAGREVTVAAPAPAVQAPQAAVPTVLLETGRLRILAKPAGLHCEKGRSAGSVAEWLEDRYGDLSQVGERAEEAGLVHRLDRDTSGLLLAARDAREYARLRRIFSRGQTRKQYLAVVTGRLDEEFVIDVPLARRGPRMAPARAHEHGLAAETAIQPLETGDGWSLVLATMRSGAMHQVRVHLAIAGHPLAGDTTYGGPSLRLPTREGQLLHAMRVQVGNELDVSLGPPADFLGALASLRRGGL